MVWRSRSFSTEIVEVDPYTVEIKLTSPLVALPSLLARQQQGLSIHPKSIMEAAASEPLSDEQYIGTGPYRFVERLADRYTLLSRFDDYVGVESDPSGYAGRKPAYLDELEFIPVPEEAARVAGLQSGEYNYLEEIIPDQIAGAAGLPRGHDRDPAAAQLRRRHHEHHRRSDERPEDPAGGAGGDRSRSRAVRPPTARGTSSRDPASCCRRRLGPRMFPPSSTTRTIPRRRRQLLEEAGYDGTPIRFLCTQEDLGDYNAAVVAQQQMEAAGFTVSLEVTDEATLDENLEDDERWDMTTNAIVFRPDPVLIAPFASCSWDGGWCSDEKVAAVERLQTEPDFEARYAALEDLQRLWYEQAPMVKLVNNYGVAALTSNVQGLLGRMHFEIEPEFANCWLEEA